MTVKFSKEKVNYTDKETGKAKTFDRINMELPNGQKTEVKATKWNYRAIDYITDAIDGKI